MIRAILKEEGFAGLFAGEYIRTAGNAPCGVRSVVCGAGELLVCGMGRCVTSVLFSFRGILVVYAVCGVELGLHGVWVGVVFEGHDSCSFGAAYVYVSYGVFCFFSVFFCFSLNLFVFPSRT